MHKILITILCLNFGLFADAQNSVTDSLQNLLYQKKDVNEKAEILKVIFDELEYSDPAKSLIAAKQLYEIADLTRDNEENKMYSLNIVGIAYMNLNMTDSSFAYYEELLEYAKSKNEKSYLIKAYNNLAALSFNAGNNDDAFNYLRSVRSLNETSGNLSDAAGDYLNIGVVYDALGSHDSSVYYCIKGIDLALKAKDSVLLTRAYMNIASIEMRSDNIEPAIEYCLKALSFGVGSGNIADVAGVYVNLGYCYYKKEDFSSAEKAYIRGIEYSINSGNLESLADAYRGLASSYVKLNDYKMAFENQKLYGEIQDSIAELNNMAKYIDMQEKYKAEETKKANEILTQKNKIQDLEIEKNAEEIQNSRIVIISSILGLVLLIVLAITLYNRNVIKQRANQQLQEANAIINEKNADILASIEYASKIQEALLPTKDNPDLFKDSFLCSSQKTL
ncbi:MAG: tetratricopeptide repeat protein [Crocinitomicaceae bacterium]|nr:tetratricopeptide repeat protein [Crocinitomicaceae bacterium]